MSPSWKTKNKTLISSGVTTLGTSQARPGHFCRLCYDIILVFLLDSISTEKDNSVENAKRTIVYQFTLV